tara:strand:- start:1165 stop:2481 length:1317 start_codon:yes stop_codon:yes gene_type:complete
MINKKIRDLVRRNYLTDGPAMRKWDNPFYIPSEQQLLYDILGNEKKGNEKNTKNNNNVVNVVSVVNSDNYERTDDDDDFDDPAFSISSNYYQAEVYKSVEDRKAFTGGIIDTELSDERHLVAYNKKTNTLSVAMRGTNPSSLLDWLNNFSMVYQSEKRDLEEWIKGSTKAKEGLELFGIPFLNYFVKTGLLVEEQIFLEAAMGLEKLDEPTKEKEKFNFQYNSEFLDDVLEQYGENVNLNLIGHSKGGGEARMLLAYLKKELPFKARSPAIIPRNIKAYTYNSLHFNWKGKNTDPDLYPIKVRGDPIDVNIQNHHPNLRIIGNQKGGTLMEKHSSANFLKDFRNIPLLGLYNQRKRTKQENRLIKKQKKYQRKQVEALFTEPLNKIKREELRLTKERREAGNFYFKRKIGTGDPFYRNAEESVDSDVSKLVRQYKGKN